MWIRVCCVLIIAAPAWAEDKKAETRIDPTLKGRWEIVSGKFNGSESAIVRGRVLKFANGELTTYFNDDEKDLTVAITFNLSTTPKQIDIDQRLGSLALGIYTIDKDTLKICYAEPGADRPKKLESAAGDRQFLLVLKRVNPDK